MQLGVRVRPVAADAYGETLAALCGWEALAAAAAPDMPFSDEMLVLCNFSSAQLNDFLGGFKRGQIPPVALKAVLTDTNLHWTATMLQQELAQEHQALAAKAAQQPSDSR